MDETRFDRIAKALATSASRRTVGKLLGGGIAGGLAASILGGGDGAANEEGPR
ncbi:MAG: hypothetical protein M3Q50_11105 [Chloroflexota bacterium]|nr:hypothetical protein [Chloroflexia bacterium]MDQ3227164.1 hypothetical protein [Chloroflexota bacterium]